MPESRERRRIMRNRRRERRRIRAESSEKDKVKRFRKGLNSERRNLRRQRWRIRQTANGEPSGLGSGRKRGGV